MQNRQTDGARPCFYWGGEKTESLSLDVFCPLTVFTGHWCGDITCLSSCWHCCLESGGILSLPPSLPPSTINYINSSLKHPPSLLLHFVTGNLSAVTLWLELVMDLTFYSTPGSALQSNFSFQHWTLSGDNEVFLWLCWFHHISVCPSTPRAQLTEKLIIQNNGKDGCSAVNLKPIFPNITWLMFRLCFQLEMICQHPLCIMFSFFTCVNYVLLVRSWWRHVAC